MGHRVGSMGSGCLGPADGTCPGVPARRDVPGVPQGSRAGLTPLRASSPVPGLELLLSAQGPATFVTKCFSF